MEEKIISAREKEVLGLIFEGKNNKDIARMLVITEGTVEGHVRNILHKLGAQSRSHAVHIAIKNRLLHADILVDGSEYGGVGWIKFGKYAHFRSEADGMYIGPFILDLNKEGDVIIVLSWANEE